MYQGVRRVMSKQEGLKDPSSAGGKPFLLPMHELDTWSRKEGGILVADDHLLARYGWVFMEANLFRLDKFFKT
eukprot:1134187-Pelagomonas_calceolata.AAC.3